MNKLLSFIGQNLFSIDIYNVRKMKLFLCGGLLILSFFIVGYRTISLANINKQVEVETLAKMKLEKEIEDKHIRGSIFDRENNLLASTIKVSSLFILSIYKNKLASKQNSVIVYAQTTGELI